MAQTNYQWYPGHMTKARRMMEENGRIVDLIIELADARIPFSSRNPDIGNMFPGKARLLIFTREDLADPVITKNVIGQLESRGIPSVAVDARTRRGLDKIRREIDKACEAKRERDRRRGIVGRPVRAMVAGIPNVGKSTFINSFAGKAGAKTGNKPGVTRGKQWIRVNKELELLDTPGILWPKFEDPEVGKRLALTGAIRQELLDEEALALDLLAYLSEHYRELLEGRYFSSSGAACEGAPHDDNLREDTPHDDEPCGDTARKNGLSEDLPYGDPPELLRRIALSRGLLRSGGEPDLGRTASLVLDEFRSGRIGRITLEGSRME